MMDIKAGSKVKFKKRFTNDSMYDHTFKEIQEWKEGIFTVAETRGCHLCLEGYVWHTIGSKQFKHWINMDYFDHVGDHIFQYDILEGCSE
jgi:hypothetical protein